MGRYCYFLVLTKMLVNLRGLLHRSVDGVGSSIFSHIAGGIHDLNIYNFVIELSQSLKEQNRDIEPPARLDFSSISDDFSGYEDFSRGRWNFVDIQTAIELYTPLYLLFLPRNDFVRAANSLQLDELIGVYVAKLLGTDYHLNFVVNGHPMRISP